MIKFKSQDKDLKNKLLEKLHLICMARNISRYSEPGSWPNTRVIADACELNIYKARYLLLKLVAEDMVETTAELVERSRRWRVKQH